MRRGGANPSAAVVRHLLGLIRTEIDEDGNLAIENGAALKISRRIGCRPRMKAGVDSAIVSKGE